MGNDDISLEEAFCQNFKILLRACYKKVGTEVAEDLVMEVFLLLSQKWDSLNSHSAKSITVWLHSTLANKSFEYYRAKQKNVEYDYERIQDYSGYDPIQEMIEDIQYKLYVEELKKCLPPSEAELFECVVSKGLSLDEATEVLHISRNLLHVRVFRMKQHIGEFLEEKKKSFDSM